MSSFGFELGGLEELQEDLNRVFQEYPEETSKKAYSLAGEFTKDVNTKFPSGYSDGKRSLFKSWKREREKALFSGFTVVVNVTNTAPHFHLVENGHKGIIPENGLILHRGQKNRAPNKKPGKMLKKTVNMKSIGFVPGKHYCESTRREWQDKLPEKVEAFVDKMLKEHDL